MFFLQKDQFTTEYSSLQPFSCGYSGKNINI